VKRYSQPASQPVALFPSLWDASMSNSLDKLKSRQGWLMIKIKSPQAPFSQKTEYYSFRGCF